MECPKCNKAGSWAEEQYSFGIYAGRMCDACAYESYRDHCGLVKLPNGEYAEAEQGDVTTLDEFQAGGWDAINGEDY